MESVVSAPDVSPEGRASRPEVTESPRTVGRLRVLGRWLTIHRVFATYALLWLVDLTRVRTLWWWVRRREGRRVTGPVAWRRAFEELGPTYVKLGQMIASGDGLFPARYSEEFRSCLDRVPPFGFDEVTRTLREELGRPHAELFEAIEERPAAAASIAQVHYARLLDGAEVVVKVQRPRIAETMAADVAIMRVLARLLSRVVPHVKLANPVGIVEDLERTLFEELDFRREARNMEEFNAILAAAQNTEVVAPRVHWDLTRTRVLTMERFRGARVDDTEALRAGPHDAEAKLLAGIRGWFQCLLRRGFFHGDVHAGNFMLLDDGRVGFLDFGIIGRFDDAQKAMVTEYVLAFQTADFSRLAEVLVRMGSVDGAAIDMQRFTVELAGAFAPMVGGTSDARIKDILPDMLRVAVKNRMRMPREFVLVTKQLVYLDRYARAIGGPKMNVLTDARVMGFILEDLAALAAS